MKPVNFEFEISEELELLQRQRAEELKSNVIVQTWLQKNQLPLSFVDSHTSILSKYVSSLTKCQGCMGLTTCTQSTIGQFDDLAIDAQGVSIVINTCKYTREENAKNAYLAKFVFNDMNKELEGVYLKDLLLAKDENIDYKKAISEVLIGKQESSKGFYLWGAPGVGKSYLLGAILNEFAREGKRVAFVHMPTLSAKLKRLFSKNNEMDEMLYQLETVDVLVIDDIGGEVAGPWIRDEVLLPLLDARLRENKRTYFSSNYTLEDLKKKYSLDGQRGQDPMAAERLGERLNYLTKALQIKGKSRRVY